MKCAGLFASFSIGCLAIGCGSPDVPDGIDCGAVISGGSGRQHLADALLEAESGDCVVVHDEIYRGAFVVPSGVKLVAEKGTAPEIRGSEANAPAISITASQGSGIWGVTINGAEANGIFATGAGATFVDVTVTGTGAAAMAIRCDGPSCTDGTAFYQLTNVVLRDSLVGLWIKGATVQVDGGEVSHNGGSNLTAGHGVFAFGGAQLTMRGATVEGNDYGVFLDGDNGTRGAFTDIKVLANQERGMWVQRLRGTQSEPALDISGSGTLFEGNSLTGLGAVDSVGIIFVSGTVGGTVLKPIVNDLGTIAEIGDGIGLFAGSGDVTIDGVTLRGNQRAQMLVDNGSVGIIFVSGQVEPVGSQLKIVVQNTSATVDVPASDLDSTPNPLAVSAPLLPLLDVIP